MQIGELAPAPQAQAETQCCDERQGWLPLAPRGEGSHRSDGPEQAGRLVFLRHFRSPGMTLDEIPVLLRFNDQPQAGCGAGAFSAGRQAGKCACVRGACRACQWPSPSRVGGGMAVVACGRRTARSAGSRCPWAWPATAAPSPPWIGLAGDGDAAVGRQAPLHIAGMPVRRRHGACDVRKRRSPGWRGFAGVYGSV